MRNVVILTSALP